MKIILGLLLTVPMLFWIGYRSICSIQATRYCGNHIELAARTNDPAIAAAELDKAIAYADQQGWTGGFTSILWRTPDEDIGYWYQNLVVARNDLKAIANDPSPLERSNVMMRVRETLVEHGKEGTGVVAPDGITVYPANTGTAVFGCLALLLLFPAGYLIMVGVDDL